MTADKPKTDLARLYAGTRERVAALVTGLDDDALATPVPACPGWSVQDVVAHLAAMAEDVTAGRLSGPPDGEQTAAQVARFAGRGVADVLAAWTAAAPAVEEAIGAFRVWPAVIDAASHEQDIRGALHRPGARDTEVVRESADRLLRGLRPPVPLRVSVEDADYQAGPEPVAGEAVLSLVTTRFETLRWRMGRRSRAQLAALGWSGDPAAVLDCLTVFGPAAGDILE